MIATKTYQFKGKNSAIKPYPLCLGNIFRKILQGLNGYIYDVSVDYNTVDICHIINSHKCLMKIM